MQSKLWLLIVLFAFIQCKKENDCASSEERLIKAPSVDLDANDLSKLTYYDLSQVIFAKNDTAVVTYNLIKKDQRYEPFIHGGWPSAKPCPDYIAKCQENLLTFQDGDNYKLCVAHQRQIPGLSNDSVKVQLGLSIGGAYPMIVHNPPIQDNGIFGVFDCAVFDDAPDLANMEVRGKMYSHVYVSTLAYERTGVFVFDSIYYTVNDGIIRASQKNGDVYELIK